MHKVTVAIILVLLVNGCNNHRSDTGSRTQEHLPEKQVYDSILARELGADSYGMKQYVMAFLMRGDSSSADSAEAESLQQAHLDNITRMAQEGKLVLAGPFLDDTDIRGIYIFNVSTMEEAEQLTGSDPAIKAGVLKMELHPWYGSAALQKLNDIHERIQADNF